MKASDWINLVIACFTAIAAFISARASRQAVEEAKKAGDNSAKIAAEQTKAMLTAARANALASRIDFFNQQIDDTRARMEKNSMSSSG
jgi:hypothetical protein